MTRHKSQDERRKQILSAARHCFIEKGYDNSRMDDIARQADLSKGGVYFHFDGKRQIFRALVEEEFQASIGFLQETVDTPGSASSKLAKVGRFYLDMVVKDPTQPRFMVVLGEMAIRDPSIAELLRSMHERFVATLTELIEAGIQAKEIRPIHARSAAVILKGIVDGLEASLTVGARIDMDEVVPTALQILTHGLVQTEGS